MFFDLLEASYVSPAILAEGMRINRKNLSRKARLRVGNVETSEPVDLLIMASNSYKALDIVFDFLDANFHQLFVSPGWAQHILSRSCAPRSGTISFTPGKARKGKPGGMVTQFSGKRKLIIGPFIRYAQLAMKTIGKEKISKYIQGHLLEVERRIRFVVDVLADVREGGLTAVDLDPVLDGVRILAELGPEFDRELLHKLAEGLRDPESSERYQYERKDELIELTFRAITND
jgi:hypothetical protein